MNKRNPKDIIDKYLRPHLRPEIKPAPVASPSQKISTLADKRNASARSSIPANVSSFLAANKNQALTKGPSYADTMRTALKNAPKVTPEIQGMADMSSAIARGPRPNPLNPTGSLNGPRFGGMGMKKGGKVSSASKRADGIAKQGKTKGRII